MKKFYSHGKLLITGEYAVLDGAKALALPTKYGQEMQVESTDKPEISWTSLDEKEDIWFGGSFILKNDNFFLKEENNKPSVLDSRLLQVLNAAKMLNPEFFSEKQGFKITTKLDFNRKWGLGSSSTLINNIASWLNIDAYKLLEKTFGGSGYDIAAAQQDSAFTYQLIKGQASVLKSHFEPQFEDKLFFVYLNQKQNSREAIAHYRNQPRENIDVLTDKISGLTEQFLHCETLHEFRVLMDLHETLISKAINLPKIKTRLFPDFSGSIKSLGGWGGDFVLATGSEEDQQYFRDKNYNTIIPFSKMKL
ncbi:MAG: GYDIA family GHMP kinase [Salegentibacter sp.]|uniref:Mevalonate kinase n=1 Tax=Salegentibacter flavus TaxID=287099 RepID=A0A1I5AFS7_9FLAO|nr:MULTISPECIES: GYDIA family GHMP kinase [Salegentibacter]MDR9457098.1 GYDIA family GHMP kinase [Salegentibacter sp.]SFN61331.1 Mevalonate kinase [Salegentibacter flavus]